MDPVLVSLMEETFNIVCWDNPGKYLGLPADWARFKSGTLSWIMERVQAKVEAIAFVARDSNGALLTGHGKRVAASSPLVAEALTLREAILATYNFNWNKVVFESDCLTLIEACRKDKVVAEIQGVVADILTVAEGFIHCGFTWVRRQGNKVAHQITQASISNSLPLSWVSNQPDWLLRLLFEDVRHCASLRSHQLF
ncbi:Ribonuclease H superfamily [Sesbania bispinosa]|nr:Ribonuclease H superfamily [Sesbania bispinosa]